MSVIDEAKARKRLPPPTMRRAIREAAGVSQRRLARELGVSGQAVGYWERGIRHPRGENLERYTSMLHDLREVSEGDIALLDQLVTVR